MHKYLLFKIVETLLLAPMTGQYVISTSPAAEFTYVPATANLF